MADNTVLNAPTTSGDTIATDDIGGGVKIQRVKPAVGADGVAVDVAPISSANDTSGVTVPSAGLVAQLDDTATATVAEGNYGVVRMTADRALLTDAVSGGTLIDKLDEQLVELGSISTNTLAPTLAMNVFGAALPSWGVLQGASDGGSMRAVRSDSTGNQTAVGNVAHDAIDTSNPAKIGGRADTTFQTAVSDGDRVDALFDVYGSQYVRPDQPNKWSYHENSTSALTDALVQASPPAGFSLYITDIIFSNGAATAVSVFLEEGSTTILGPYYLEAIVGRSIHIRFATPKKCTAATNLTVTTSPAGSHGLDILGFIAP